MKIYTRTGDKGTTSLVGGKRAVKCDLRIEAYGTVDELMAHIGYLHDRLEDRSVRLQLESVLNRLMDCASLLAADETIWDRLPRIEPEDVAVLEQQTDAWLAGLPELKHFTLPCGNPLVSLTHICRTICRRAERRAVEMVEAGYPVPEPVMAYLNRLSDYLYALGRRLGYDAGAPDVIWEPKK